MKNISHLNIIKNSAGTITGKDEFEEFRNNQNLLIDKGYDLIEKGEYYQAFTLFSIGTVFNREDPEILKGLGIALFEMGDLGKSKVILERACRLNPNDPITLANLAGVCWEMGNYDNAIHNYCKSLEIDSEIEETYFNLINLYIEAGHFYMAFITCNNFMKLYPENDEIRDLMNDILINLAISIY